MGDTYVEHMVKAKTSNTQMMIRMTAIVGCIFVAYIALVILGITFAAIAIFGLAYLVYYIIIMTDLEYEYVLVNGELTIDCIYGKSKRKQAAKFDITKCEMIAPIESTYVAGYNRNENMKKMDYTSGGSLDNVYLLIIAYGAESAKVYLEMTTEMLSAMKTSAPNKVKN